MQTVKQKLLEVIGEVALEVLTEERLIEVLADVVKAKNKTIEELSSKNAHRELMLHSAEEAVQREYRELRRNPAMCISGPFYFAGTKKGENFRVTIMRGQVEMVEKRKSGEGFVQTLAQIAAEEFYDDKR